ncbi:MAG: nucleotidyl transferase AbiEii/AbiGii toxin family protein [Betaproteobacteria bacterium]
MTPRTVKNLAASVRQRLANLAQSRGEQFQYVAEHYAIERFLYRLSISSHAERFLLKGALLFKLWYDEPHRRTRDADLLGIGAPDVAALAKCFRELCVIRYEDGITFDADSVRASAIREGMVYQGVRVKFSGELARAVIPVQFDVGFGDAVTPGPEEIVFPGLLDFPRPRLRAYPKYTVVAEKTEAMVVFGEQNSRMRDFYDLWVLARTQPFEGPLLADAFSATFSRRRTAFPAGIPVGLTDDFARSPLTQTRWKAFLGRSQLDSRTEFPAVLSSLREFLLQPLAAAAKGEVFRASWSPGGPWKPNE